MALNNFFRINMPYGIARNENNEWFAFNREYMPLGYNDTKYKRPKRFIEGSFSEFPVFTEYKRLTDTSLLEIAGSEERIKRTDGGQIEIVFLYNDTTNPSDDAKHWTDYFSKIKLLSKLERKS